MLALAAVVRGEDGVVLSELKREGLAALLVVVPFVLVLLISGPFVRLDLSLPALQVPDLSFVGPVDRPPTATPAATPTATPEPAPVVAAAEPTVVDPALPVPAYPDTLAPMVRANPGTGFVALTMDAGGGDKGRTDFVLDTLRAAGVHATFFLTGQWAEAFPDLVRRMAAEGHEVANHSYDHPDFRLVPDAEISREMQMTDQVLLKIAGKPPSKLMRPPFGSYDQRVLHVLRDDGYEVIYWTLDSGDWRPEVTGPEAARKVGMEANAGDIVVMHCYTDAGADTIAPALEMLKQRGLSVGTLSQALGR